MKKSNQIKKNIFISAYRNVSIRYILNSELFDNLVGNKELRIIVFVKKQHLEYCKKRYKYDNVIFENVYFEELFARLRSYIGTFFNLYRLMTFPKNKLPKNETIDIFRVTYRKEWVNSTKRLIIFNIIKFFSLIGKNSKIFRLLMIKVESLFSDGSIYKSIFKKYEPDMIIVSSIGHMIDVYLMNQAKINKVKILTIFHNWDGPTTKGYKSSDIDYAISWNDIMSKEIENYLDIPAKNIFLGGAINYERYFKLKPANRSKPKKTILFASGGLSLWPNNFEPLYHILENKNNYKYEINVVLRMHPNFISNESSRENIVLKNDVNSIIDKLKNLYLDNFTLSIPSVKQFESDYLFRNEDLNNLTELLLSSDILITQYSTLLLEAAILDTPAINIGYGQYRKNLMPANYYEKSTHIKTVMKFESFYNAYSNNDLDMHINTALEEPNKKSKNQQVLRDNMFPVRENVGRNIARHIEKLVFNNK